MCITVGHFMMSDVTLFKPAYRFNRNAEVILELVSLWLVTISRNVSDTIASLKSLKSALELVTKNGV